MIKSPCKSVCELDPSTGFCLGCKRSIDEINNWSLKDDKEKIMAHLYVRHMGDLSGGQMIKKKVPGKGTMYEFDGEVNDLKTKIRAKIHDGLADEAKICFDFATNAFREMMEHERND